MFVLKTFLSSYGFPLSVVRLGFNAKSHLYITQHGIFWKEYSKEDSPSLASRGEKERHRGGEVVDTEQINAKETAAEWRVNTTRVQTNRETSLTPTVPDTCLVCTASRLRPAPDLRDTHTYTWGSVCWFEVLAGTCRNSLHFLLFHCTSWCLQRNRKKPSAWSKGLLSHYKHLRMTSHHVSLWFMAAILNANALTGQLYEFVIDNNVLRFVQVVDQQNHIWSCKLVCPINSLTLTICPKNSILSKQVRWGCWEVPTN